MDPPTPEEALVCSDSEPERVGNKTTTTTTTTTTTDNKQPRKNRLSNVIAQFRHQPTKQLHSISSTSSSSSSSISIVRNKPPQPTSISSSSSNRKKKYSGSSDQLESDKQVKISYSILLRLKSCPACKNSWTTYKSPQSKLNHIQKCAQKELIQPKHILQRIDSILEEQDINSNQAKGLLERHSSNQNLVTTTQTISNFSSPLSPPKQTHQLPPQVVHHIDNQPSCSTNSSKNILHHEIVSTPSSSESSLALRSSKLNKIHSQTVERNSKIVTKNHSSTPYSLWNLASCHDDFQYDRCRRRSSHSHRGTHETWQVEMNESEGYSTPNVGRKDGEEEMTRQLRRLKLTPHTTDDIRLEPSCSYKKMPKYKEWSHQELKNESERLGFDDGSDLSVNGLVDRAQLAWNFLFNPASSHLTSPNNIHHGDQLSDTNESGSEVYNNDYGYDDYDDIEWANNLLNPEDLQEQYLRTNRSEETLGEAEGEENVLDQKKKKKENNGRQRPIFENYSKIELENEYKNLINKFKTTTTTNIDEKKLEEIIKKNRINLDKNIPKTRSSLINQVIKLWDILYLYSSPNLQHNNNNNNDNKEGVEDENIITSSLTNNKVKIVKIKLNLSDLNHLMIHLFHTSESDLYLRILRYEPIKLSVIEEKIKAQLEEEFKNNYIEKTKQKQQEEDDNDEESEEEEEEEERCEDESTSGSEITNTKNQDKLHQTNNNKDQVNVKGKGKSKSKSKVNDKGKGSVKEKSKKKVKKEIIQVEKRVINLDVLVRWLDYHAISYFLLDPSVNRNRSYHY